MLRVAVTGASGFVGNELCSYLSSTPNLILTRVIRGSNTTSANTLNIEQTDDAELVRLLSEYDCLIHLAARAHTKNATKQDFQRDNVELSTRLAKIAVSAKIKHFIYLSSVKVLGNTTKINLPFNNGSQPNPTDIYGKSKRESEIAIIDLLQNSTTYFTIVRPPLVWGSRCKGNLNTLIKFINNSIPIPAAGIKNSRDLISIDNLCSFLKHLILHPNAANKTFLVSDEKKRSTPEIIRMLEIYSTKKAKLIWAPNIFFTLIKLFPKFNAMASSFHDNLEVDISETKRILDWAPKN